MRRSPRQIRLYIAAIVCAVAPIAFALIRAFRSQYDLRMLWMAFAAFAGSAVVMRVGDARSRTFRELLILAGVALVVAMICSGWIALHLGATAAAGIWPVAFVLSGCWVVSFLLDTLSRRPPP